MIKHSCTPASRSGFSLLELSVVIGVIALVMGMSLTVGTRQVEQQKVKSTFSELKVIKDALNLYGRMHGKLPCPAPLNVATTDATYGYPAADCDGTPTSGVTYVASPATQSGAVPIRALGLSDDLMVDDWGNRYVYTVSYNTITEITSDTDGVITVEDRGANAITTDAAFVVYSAGATGLGSINHKTLATTSCSGTQLDKENCGGTAGTYMDSTIRETETAATFYDDLLVWGTCDNILSEVATIIPEEPTPACNVGAGVTINGVATPHSAGKALSPAGDVNGDGYMDFFIGAPSATPNGAASGASYVVFGKGTGWVPTFELSTLDGSNGFALNGVAATNYSGQTLQAAGDVNGDGYDDVIIGAYAADVGLTDNGASYVVFGKASGWTSSVNLSTLNGTTGFIITGAAASDQSGFAVSKAGDVNGDGYDDVIVGARYADPNGNSAAGSAYVVFGKASGWAASVSLADIGTTLNGFKLNGEAVDDNAGSSVSNAGDINGDGYDDVVVGAYGNDSNGAGAGAAYVVFGKASGWAASINLSTLAGSDGFKVLGNASTSLGYSVSGGGDMNGDGYDDVIISGHGLDSPTTNAGAAYVIFGKASGWAATFTASTVNGTTGTSLTGSAFNNYVGNYVFNAGDVNGDGYDDLITGTPYIGTNGSMSGAAYVLFGKASGWTASTSISALDGSNGFVMNGVLANDYAGYAVAGAGDVNTDGYADFIVGAPYVDTNGNNAGASYLIFGSSASWPATIELGALEDPSGCESNVCPITVSMNLDGNASTNSWRLADSDGNTKMKATFTSGDNNTTVTRSYVLPPSAKTYTLTLTDGGDGLATVSDELKLTDDTLSATVSQKTGTAAFTLCYKDFDTDTSCGFDNGGSATMTCGGQCDLVTGMAIPGAAAGENLGNADTSMGDINGDGYDDIIVGAQNASPNGSQSGAAYVIFGSASGSTSSFDLTTLNGTNGVKFNGEAASYHTGWAVALNGDVNGDGYNDAIIGAPDSSTGIVYVVFGKASGWTSPINLSGLLGASTGFKLTGIGAGDRTGFSVNAADINGDGYDDILIGAPLYSGSDQGAAFVVFGKASGWANSIALSGLTGTDGFRYTGIDGTDISGATVAGGDVNGDGYDDLVVGAYQGDAGGSNSGEAYVVFGKASGFASTQAFSTLTGTNGFRVDGAAASNAFAGKVSVADINSDGKADIVFGATAVATNGANSGATYVLFGKKKGWTASMSVTSLTGSNGFTVNGAAASDSLGTRLGVAGDFNGDGYDEFLLGAYSINRLYMLMGKASGWSATYNASTFTTNLGMIINGSGTFTSALGGGGDFNGDGYDDIIVGATSDASNGANSGKAYLMFGSPEAYSTSAYSTGSLNTPGVFCSGCSPACDDTCNGYTLEKRACQGGSCNITSSTANSPLCGYEPICTPGTGIIFYGASSTDYAGTAVGGGGDFNGDGKADIVTGAYAGPDRNGWPSGVEYGLYGKDTGWTSPFILSSISSGTIGFKLSRPASSSVSDALGKGTTYIGDVNNDGYDDLFIGAPDTDPAGWGYPDYTAQGYVLLGKASLSTSAGWKNLAGGSGLGSAGGQIKGNQYRFGLSVSPAGDTNGDGYDEFITGDYGWSTDPGAAYLWMGGSYWPNSTWDTASPNGTMLAKFTGVTNDDRAGWSVGGDGDFNGDGKKDFIIGAPYADPNGSASGATYVVFGKAAAWASNTNLSTLNGTTGFKLSGVAASDLSGYSVASAGDVNGDGYDDILIGAPGVDTIGSAAGAVYVVFGKGTAWVSNTNLSTLNGTTGFVINGVTAADQAGYSVSTAGDINGDGYDDILIGAKYADKYVSDYPGAAYVVFGKASWGASFNLSSLTGANGFKMTGKSWSTSYSDNAGASVSNAGDVNGDGYDDIMIGAPRSNGNGAASGGSYLVFGSPNAFPANINLWSLTACNF